MVPVMSPEVIDWAEDWALKVDTASAAPRDAETTALRDSLNFAIAFPFPVKSGERPGSITPPLVVIRTSMTKIVTFSILILAHPDISVSNHFGAHPRGPQTTGRLTMVFRTQCR